MQMLQEMVLERMSPAKHEVAPASPEILALRLEERPGRKSWSRLRTYGEQAVFCSRRLRYWTVELCELKALFGSKTARRTHRHSIISH